MHISNNFGHQQINILNRLKILIRILKKPSQSIRKFRINPANILRNRYLNNNYVSLGHSVVLHNVS